MMGVMQIQMHGASNEDIAAGCALLMKAVYGNLPDDSEVQAVKTALES